MSAHNDSLCSTLGREAEFRSAAARSWATIALQRLYSRKPLDDAARDVLQSMATAIAFEAELALEASEKLTAAIRPITEGLMLDTARKSTVVDRSYQLLALLDVCVRARSTLVNRVLGTAVPREAGSLYKALELASELAGEVHDTLELAEMKAGDAATDN